MSRAQDLINPDSKGKADKCRATVVNSTNNEDMNKCYVHGPWYDEKERVRGHSEHL